MHTDRAGLAVSATSAATVEAIDRFGDEVLSHGQQAAALIAAAEADPGSTLAQALVGALFLFLQTADGIQRAAPWLARAHAVRRDANERECLWLAALDAWSQGQAGTALAVHRLIARHWPRDLLNAKLAQIHQLNLGDRTGMRVLTSSLLDANAERSYAWGLHAFALEQVGELDAARAAGERAVLMNADDPWAQHAVAHVFEARSDFDAGRDWLLAHAPSWRRCSSFMLTHNWWHVALFELGRGDAQAALAIYDREVWGVRKSYVQDQINAVSLLARIEHCGIDVGERWADLAQHTRARIHDRQNAFVDLHFAFALARAGDDGAVGELLVGIAARARQSSTPAWRELALPAARGVVAFARHRLREAATELQPLAERMHLLGGSTAQQGWFAQMRQAA